MSGLRQAIHAIEQERTERQPSRQWSGMHAAVAAVENLISRQALPPVPTPTPETKG